FSRILSGHARHFYFREVATDRALLQQRCSRYAPIRREAYGCAIVTFRTNSGCAWTARDSQIGTGNGNIEWLRSLHFLGSAWKCCRRVAGFDFASAPESSVRVIRIARPDRSRFLRSGIFEAVTMTHSLSATPADEGAVS